MPVLIIKAHLECNCKEPLGVIQIDGNKMFCKQCGSLVTISYPRMARGTRFRRFWALETIDEDHIAELERSVRSLVATNSSLRADQEHKDELIYDLQNSYRLLNNRYRCLTESLNTMRDRMEQRRIESDRIFKERMDALLRKNAGLTHDLESVNASLDSARGELSKKTERILKLIENEAELNKAVKDLTDERNGLKTSVTKASDRLRVSVAENESLRETAAHYKNEAENAGRIPLRDVVSAFLGYCAAVADTVQSRCSEDVAEQVSMRTEQLGYKLDSLGIHLGYHRRGEELGQGRADISVRETSEKEDDGRIARIQSFGCAFDADYADIPESLTVYRYVEPEPVVSEPTDPIGSEGDTASAEESSDVIATAEANEIVSESSEQSIVPAFESVSGTDEVAIDAAEAVITVPEKNEGPADPVSGEHLDSGEIENTEQVTVVESDVLSVDGGQASPSEDVESVQDNETDGKDCAVAEDAVPKGDSELAAETSPKAVPVDSSVHTVGISNPEKQSGQNGMRIITIEF